MINFDDIPVSGRPTPGYVFRGDATVRKVLNEQLPNLTFDHLLKKFPDMETKKKNLLLRIQKLGYREPNLKEPLRVPVVSLEDFFDGNDSLYSIAPNLEFHPKPSQFRDELLLIRQHPDVEFVLVDVWHVDTGGFQEPSWPTAEFVYVGGNIRDETLEKWRTDLLADQVLLGWEDEVVPAGLPTHFLTSTVHRFWWD